MMHFNGLKGTLGANMAPGDTVLPLAYPLYHANGTPVPTLGVGEWFWVTLLDAFGSLSEIVKVTGYTSGALSATIARAQQGTPALDHAAGRTYIAASTALSIDLKAPLDSPAFTGTPTGITRLHVGLGNVDNTSDLAKPISTATGTALALKAPLASPAFTGTVTGITKVMVGLGYAENTADLDKPISTATQIALDDKADLIGGLIPTSQLPSSTFTTVVPVADEATMLALTTIDVQPGDVATRLDGAGTFILKGTDPSVLSNWVLLNAPTDVVTSINGQIGGVVLGYADVGADAAGAASSALTSAQSYTDNAVTTLNTAIGAKATDSLVVHLAGAETITGAKTFSGNLLASGAWSGSTPPVRIGTIGAAGGVTFARASDGSLQGYIGYLSATDSGSMTMMSGGGSGVLRFYTGGTQRLLIDSVGATTAASAHAGTNGTPAALSVTPVLTQSGTAGYTGLLVNATETTTGNGAKRLLDLQVGGTSKFSVDNAGATAVAGLLTVSASAFLPAGSLFGLQTSLPTHSLTLGSTSTGAAFYNTTDQTVNYERSRAYWAANVFTLAVERGGTGTGRSLSLQSQISGTAATLAIARAGIPYFAFNVGNASGATTVGMAQFFSGDQFTGTGAQVAIGVVPTIAQTSAGSYTALLVNPTETSVGSGSKTLLDLQVGGTTKFKVDNTGSFVSGGTSIVISARAAILSGADAQPTLVLRGNSTVATVTNKALASNVATLTLSSVTGMVTGQKVTVAGVDATFNGSFLLTGVNSGTSTVTYALTAADVASVAATGTATVMTQTASQLRIQDAGGTDVFTVGATGGVVLGTTLVPAGLTVTGASTLSGNVAMGTATVSGSLLLSPATGFTSLTDMPLRVGKGSAAGAMSFARGSDGTFLGSIGYASATEAAQFAIQAGGGSGYLTFYTAGALRQTIDASGNVGIGATAPTHSLTLASTGTGAAFYNTTDQTTNYERARLSWVSNVFTIGTEKGGTGTIRSLQLQTSSGRAIVLNDTASAGVPFVNLSQSSSLAGVTFVGLAHGMSATSGVQVGLGITPTITQTVTGGYTALLVNPTETTTGNGTKLLADFQVGGVSRVSISSAGQLLAAVNWGSTANAAPIKVGATGLSGAIAFGRASDGASQAYIGYASASDSTNFVIGSSGGGATLQLQVGGTTRQTIDSNGTGTFASALAASSGAQYGISITPTISQTGTAGYTSLFVNATETTVGSGAKLLADLQVGGVSKAKVDNTGLLTVVGAGAMAVGAQIANAKLTLLTGADTYPGLLIRANGITATVSNAALTSNVATITTAAAHGFAVGFSVTVAAVSAVFNGTYTITSVPSSTTFTYAKVNADVTSFAVAGTAASTTQTGPLARVQDYLGNDMLQVTNTGGVNIGSSTAAGNKTLSVRNGDATTSSYTEINAQNGNGVYAKVGVFNNVAQIGSVSAHNVQFFYGNAAKLTLTSSQFQIADAVDLTTGTATGTKIGTASTQKLAFYGATPIVQPSGTPAAATDLATALTLVNDLRAKLLALGLAA